MDPIEILIIGLPTALILYAVVRAAMIIHTLRRIAERQRALLGNAEKLAMEQARDRAKPIPFNINDNVLVRLTPAGHEILQRQHEELCKQVSPGFFGEYVPPEQDKDGWSKWQLWRLFEAFASHIYLSAGPDELPFRPDILIGEAPRRTVHTLEPGERAEFWDEEQ